jgi:Tfp pilus assembly protein PilF
VNVLTNPARRKAHDFDLTKGGEGAVHDQAAVAKVYLAKGVKAYKEGDFATAFDAFDMSVKHWDKDPKAHHYLALSAQKLPARVKRGAEAIEVAIKLEPHNAVLRRDAGKLYVMAGMSLKAERHLEEALRWAPDDTESQQLLEKLRSSSDSGRSHLGNLFGRKG